MKRLTVAILGLVLVASLAFAVSRSAFLNGQKSDYEDELAEVEAARDLVLNHAGRIDRINTGMPIINALIAETQDAELRQDWIELRDFYQDELDDWDADLAAWAIEIAKLEDIITEVQRLIDNPP